MAEIRLDHCVIAVSDWERANAFYRDVLGAELVQRIEYTQAYPFDTVTVTGHADGVQLDHKPPAPPDTSKHPKTPPASPPPPPTPHP